MSNVFVSPGEVPPPRPDELEASAAEAAETNQDSIDTGAFLVSFADLPSIKQARERLLDRGYAEDDPIMTMVEVLSLYDRRAEILTSRILNAYANVINRVEELQNEVKAFPDQMDELQGALENTQDSAQVMHDQFGKVLRSNAEFIPHLTKAADRFAEGAALIESRSTKAVVLSYLSPALTLIAGVIIGLLIARF